jgi:hypothetical protein
LRKPFIAAGTAALALGVAGIAYAQTPPAPAVTGSATVSPSKAGTKSKPKSVKLKLVVQNSAESKTTAKQITITLPSTLKVSTKGLDQCTASDDDIIAGKCSKMKAGKGEAHALVNPFATDPAKVTFKVTPIVGKNQILFLLDAPTGPSVLHGKISGSKMTIPILPELQQPAPGVYSALLDLSTELSDKKGKAALISAVGCKSKKHSVGFKVDYAANPSPPSQGSASGTADAKCS